MPSRSLSIPLFSRRISTSSPRKGGGRKRGQGDSAPTAAAANKSSYCGDPKGNLKGRAEGRSVSPGRDLTVLHSLPVRASSGADARSRQTLERPGGVIFMRDQPCSVDARIQNDSDKAVVAKLNDTTCATDNGLPFRPDFGTQGRQISLRSNYFPVNVRRLEPEVQIFLYSAKIVFSGQAVKKLSRSVKRRVFRLAERTEFWQEAGMLDKVAHDNAEKLVASFLLPQPLAIQGEYYDEQESGPPAKDGTKYTVILTFVEKVDQGILNECLAGKPVDSQALSEVLSALNLILTAHPSSTGVQMGRNDKDKKHPDRLFFFDKPQPRDVGGGLVVREGFYVSVRPAHQQLMVNVNTNHPIFYKAQNFVNAMEEHRHATGRNTAWGAFGNQVRVRTRPNDRIVMIQGVSTQNASDHKFEHEQHKLVSVAEYYKLKYKIKLKRPNLPLLIGSNGGFFPPEVCDILPDQVFKGKLTSSNRVTKIIPKENANKIVKRGLDVLGFEKSNPVLDSFGIHVGTDMAVVPGRILERPGLSYSNKPAVIDSDRASWNLSNVKFAVGARLDRWAVLVIQDGGTEDFKGSHDPVLRSVADEFRTVCNKNGMKVEPLGKGAYAEVRLPCQGKNRFRDEAITEIERAMMKLKEQSMPELVLVMLSDGDKAIYNGLKQLCDVKLDVATVCMQSAEVKKVEDRQRYLASVSLKVNMKMGGVNHTLDADSGIWLKSAPTMVMGMDVTHPTGGYPVDGAPSVVAVVASVDGHFAQYPAALAIRRGKVEIERSQGVGDSVLRDMFINRFELYKARNEGKLPERVVLFRDGVSESQFVQVREHELKELKEAAKHFGAASAPYEPKLTIVVCGKGHNTRFYPTQQKDATQEGSPLPGTVVDRGVTPAYEFDFFLQAHAGLKGTARPTHYFVVHDENRFRADEIQQVTNDLSYMLERTTTAVSLASPAYWADVACERGRCYLHKLLEGGSEAKVKVSKSDKGKDRGGKRGEDAIFKRAERMWAGGVSGARLRDTMYYV